jgi:hypothetical protein
MRPFASFLAVALLQVWSLWLLLRWGWDLLLLLVQPFGDLAPVAFVMFAGAGGAVAGAWPQLLVLNRIGLGVRWWLGNSAVGGAVGAIVAAMLLAAYAFSRLGRFRYGEGATATPFEDWGWLLVAAAIGGRVLAAFQARALEAGDDPAAPVWRWTTTVSWIAYVGIAAWPTHPRGAAMGAAITAAGVQCIGLWCSWALAPKPRVRILRDAGR